MTIETQVSPAEETQNPAAELTNENPEVVTPEVEAEQQPESQESEESKALKRMQRRIDKRTADVYRERAEKEQLAQRLAEVERRLNPEPEGEDHRARQDLNEVVKTQAQILAQEIAKQQELSNTVGSVLKAGKALPDFDAACNTVNEELPFYDGRGKPTPFLAAVLEFDQPAQLLHHLGTNPDLAAELADLSPTRLVRRLDAIEREMTEKAKPKTSAAPRPLDPVRAGASTAGPSDADSIDVWMRKENARLKAKRGY